MAKSRAFREVSPAKDEAAGNLCMILLDQNAQMPNFSIPPSLNTINLRFNSSKNSIYSKIRTTDIFHFHKSMSHHYLQFSGQKFPHDQGPKSRSFLLLVAQCKGFEPCSELFSYNRIYLLSQITSLGYF